MRQNYQLGILICQQKKEKITIVNKGRLVDSKTLPRQNKELLQLEAPLLIRQHIIDRSITIKKQAKTNKILNNLLLSLKEVKQTMSSKNPSATIF